jgi:hypothetical protein
MRSVVTDTARAHASHVSGAGAAVAETSFSIPVPKRVASIAARSGCPRAAGSGGTSRRRRWDGSLRAPGGEAASGAAVPSRERMQQRPSQPEEQAQPSREALSRKSPEPAHAEHERARRSGPQPGVARKGPGSTGRLFADGRVGSRASMQRPSHRAEHARALRATEAPGEARRVKRATVSRETPTPSSLGGRRPKKGRGGSRWA